MTVSTKVDKGGLEAGLYSSDFCFVNVSFGRNASAVFNVEIIQSLTVDKSNTDLFGLCCID